MHKNPNKSQQYDSIPCQKIVLYSTSSGTKKTVRGVERQEDEQVARVEGEGDRLQGELQHI